MPKNKMTGSCDFGFVITSEPSALTFGKLVECDALPHVSAWENDRRNDLPLPACDSALTHLGGMLEPLIFGKEWK